MFQDQNSTKYTALAVYILLLLTPHLILANDSSDETYNIGGVLADNISNKTFVDVISELNFNSKYKTSRRMTYYGKTIRMDKNPIKTVFNVCDKLIDKRVSFPHIAFYFKLILDNTQHSPL
ncbi:glutamate [NMDA] receptor subunit 1-like [Musca autumnalis]|uniref:glutamate [NMDA] receptor subunit 1-like n=1 Tax=Musca autumnalis TaxID=221902 RepID=UPI003CF6BADB